MAFDRNQFPERVRAAVAAVEAKVCVEVVVAVAPRSGSYADVDLLWAILSGLVAMVFMVHGPLLFHTDTVIANACLLGLLGWLGSRRIPVMRRLLTRSARRDRQVGEGAALFFQTRQLSQTRERRVILLYLSRFERQARVLTDVGVDALVPAAVFHAVRQTLRGANGDARLEECLFTALEELSKELPAYLPAPTDTDNQISDEPVMLT